MNERKRREAQAALSAAIHTLLDAIPPSAFFSSHVDSEDEAPMPLEDAMVILAGEMMASAYLLLEKDVEPRDAVLNVWDLLATTTEVLSAEHLASLLPAPTKKSRRDGVTIPDSRKKKDDGGAVKKSAAKAPAKVSAKAAAKPAGKKAPAKSVAAKAPAAKAKAASSKR